MTNPRTFGPIHRAFTNEPTGHRGPMTFWAVVLVLGVVAAALSWRAARHMYDDAPF